ncbi:peptidoglycan DD-metalloendopeptidase family protein [Streptomyces sp. DW26H14]|uniref:peptidoglycan DD-metalloendopeptidase family protein n=1 Tax=Streptomyces sp. DW26H14 TaxID=3435395 RepID=UPI00403DDC68
MSDDDALSQVIRRGAALRALLGVGLWPVVLAQPVAAALTGASLNASLNALAFLALGGVAYWGFGVPVASTVPRWERWAMVAAALAVVVNAALRGPRLAHDATWTDLALPLVVLALAAVALLDRCDRLAGRSSSLRWPLPPGRWQIVEGNGRLLNHHWAAPSQRGALDIVGTTADGRSARPFLPARLRDYAIYRVPVLAPADATVVVAEDGHPDAPRPGTGPAGNHIVLDTGQERVLLAHLTPGSIEVHPGDRVAAGRRLALVGSSGNSTEPHLHIHAVRDGQPLTLVFERIPGSLRRGAAVVSREPALPGPEEDPGPEEVHGRRRQA